MLLCLAISLKRASETKRDKKFAVTGIFFPLISVVTVIAVYYLLRPGDPELAQLTPTEFVTDNNIYVPYVWNSQSKDVTAEDFLSMFTNYNNFPSFVPYSNEDEINRFLLQENNGNITYGAYLFNDIRSEEGIFKTTLMYNQSSILSLPTFLSMYGEATLRTVTEDTAFSLTGSEQALSNSEKFSSLAFLFYGPFLIEYGFVFLIPFFAIHIVEEKEKRQKHQLLVSGVPLSSYWVGNLLADYSIYTISVIFNISLLYIAQISLFIENSFAGPFCVFALFGCIAVCSGYLFSFVFQRTETANKWLYSLMALLTLIPYLIVTVAFQGIVPHWVNYALCIFPPYCLYYSMFRLSFAVFLKGGLSFTETFAFDDGGLGGILLIMLIECFILIGGIILMDFGLDHIRNFLQTKISSFRFSFDSELVNADADVKHEMTQVDEINNEDVPIIIRHVWKAFKTSKEITYADRDICLAIPEGQCFGLLGPNGAGKTTLIDILTGLIQPDSGEVFISETNMSNALASDYKQIGVCQQGDVNYPLLTVYEHLLLYARIKGITGEKVKDSVEESIREMDLQDHRNKTVKQLSGGNKRKLAVAIAFTGNPNIVFLDEPSTGMDPVIRRKMWSLIDKMKEGRVIILTTHSMEEADALCERIGIMVKGSLRCLGSSQHLKSIYGSSYNISLKTTAEYSQQVQDFVYEICPESKMVRNINGAMDFEVPKENLSLGPLFSQLHEKRDVFSISDYSISQPTLEQVFLGFAREQEME